MSRPSSLAFEVGNRGCVMAKAGSRPLALAVAFAAAFAVAASPLLAQRSAEDLTGIYAGSYVCRQSKMLLDLELRARTDGALEGVTRIYPPGGDPSRPVTAYEVKGRLTPGTGAIQLDPGRPAPSQMTGPQAMPIAGRIDAAAGTIVGQMGHGCGEVRLALDRTRTAAFRRDAADRASRLARLPTSLDEASPGERCWVYLKWVSRVREEYPRMDVMNTPVNLVQDSSLNIFVDGHFVPVFGKPYDRMSLEERRARGRELAQCRANREVASDMEWAITIFMGAFVQQQGSPHHTDLVGKIAYRRDAQERIRQAARELETLSSSAESYQRATALRSELGDALATLWPSEARAFEERLGAVSGRAAGSAGGAAVDQAIASASGYDGAVELQRLVAMLSGPRVPARQVAPNDGRVSQHATPDARRRPAAPPGAAGRRGAAGNDLGELVANMPEDARRDAERKARARRDEILTGLLAEERQRIDALGSGLTALQHGAAWYREFDHRYARVFDAPAVEQTLAHFRARRQRDLAAARSPLLASIRSAPDGRQLDGIVAQHLGVPGDATGELASAIEQRRSVFAAAARRAEEERKARPCRDFALSGERSSADGEPTQEQLCEALWRDFDAKNEGYRDLAKRCEARDFGNAIVAAQCLGLCGATGGTCNLSFTITQFRKVACASAAPTGQPGWICDYVLDWTSNNAQMRDVMRTIMPSGSVGQGRFVRTERGWFRMPGR